MTCSTMAVNGFGTSEGTPMTTPIVPINTPTNDVTHGPTQFTKNPTFKLVKSLAAYTLCTKWGRVKKQMLTRLNCQNL